MKKTVKEIIKEHFNDLSEPALNAIVDKGKIIDIGKGQEIVFETA